MKCPECREDVEEIYTSKHGAMCQECIEHFDNEDALREDEEHDAYNDHLAGYQDAGDE